MPSYRLDSLKASSFLLMVAASLAAGFVVACSGSDLEDHLRDRVEGFFEATLNGDVAALEGYVSESCLAKAAFLEQTAALAVLEPVDVEVPVGGFLFDVEGDVAVVKRALGGPALLVDGVAVVDDPVNDVPLKLVREGSAWRVENCEAFVPE